MSKINEKVMRKIADLMQNDEILPRVILNVNMVKGVETLSVDLKIKIKNCMN